jgi:hypothetical protein
MDAPDVAQAMAQWSDAHALKAVPIRLWYGMVAANRARREALEQKVAVLEQQLATVQADHRELASKALTAGGTWESGVSYGVNATITHDGSLWRVVTPHTSRDVFEREYFKLIVKRGRDGRQGL